MVSYLQVLKLKCLIFIVLILIVVEDGLVLVNKVFDDNTIEIVEYGYTKTINLENIGRIKIEAYCTNN